MQNQTLRRLRPDRFAFFISNFAFLVLHFSASFVLVCSVTATVGAGQDYKDNLAADHPAIRYGERPVSDRVSQLAEALARGEAPLGAARDLQGYLPAVLRRLAIPTDSQMLVFSKTSLHAAHISPERPRAIYFTDDVVAAFVPGAPSIELAALDAAIGPIFYTISLNDRGAPSVTRSTACLRCHQGPNTAGVPGIYVGSVIPGPTGAPLRDDTAIITDHTTPFRDRWGGWYVTARRGQQPDRANAVASNPAEPGELVHELPPNVTNLAGRFHVGGYLAPTSDIVALMTFEHQTQMTNLITRVAWEERSGQKASSVEDLVAYMLFSGEAPLAQPIEGVSTFAATFPQRGPRDTRGRSLRDFDLRTRLFRYPLSYMIHSDAFAALPAAARAHVYRRLHAVLTGKDTSAKYAHLSPADRRAILEILADTKPDAGALATRP